MKKAHDLCPEVAKSMEACKASEVREFESLEGKFLFQHRWWSLCKMAPDHNFMVRKVTNKRIIVTAYCSCLVMSKRAFFPLSNDPKQLPKHIK